jgi:hypothetical protein
MAYDTAEYCSVKSGSKKTQMKIPEQMFFENITYAFFCQTFKEKRPMERHIYCDSSG